MTAKPSLVSVVDDDQSGRESLAHLLRQLAVANAVRAALGRPNSGSVTAT
jgi:hypothetical protein